MFLRILGFISITYGLTIFSARSGSMFWLAWEAIGVFFFVWAWLIRQGFFEKHRVIKGIGIAALVFYTVLLLSICAMILRGFSSTGRKNLDYIIVLGAQVWEDGPSRVLL